MGDRAVSAEAEPEPSGDWTRFLRRRDLRQVLDGLPDKVQGPALEVGFGGGELQPLLGDCFGEVTGVDVRPRTRIPPGTCVATVERLPFADRSFGFVFSSNVLEHVERLDDALAEVHRVSRDDGLLVHTMPTPTWKLLQVGLFPVHRLLQVLRIAMGRSDDAANGSGTPEDLVEQEQRDRPVWSGHPRRVSEQWPGWRRALLPPVHGASGSNLEELLAFRIDRWRRRFESSGFEVLKVEPLYLHSAYRFLPFRALGLRDALARRGLCSVAAYWTRKT